MGKNTKTVFKSFDYLQCDDFAKLLMDMAAKGWHFKEWGVGLKFEKGEPKQTNYAVEVFTNASEYDLRPEPNTEEFAEYCKEAGWELVDAKRKFCIFKQVREEAMPILTTEERVENAFAESKSGVAISFIIPGMLFLKQIQGYFDENIYSFVSHLFSPYELTFMVLLGTIFIGRILNVIAWYYYKHKMKRKLAAGESVYIGEANGNRNWLALCSRWIALIGLIVGFGMLPIEWMIPLGTFMGGSIFTIWIASLLLAKFRPDSDTNYVIQMVLSFFYVTVVIIVALCWSVEESETTVTKAPVVKADYMEYLSEVQKIDRLAHDNILGSSEIYIIDYAYADEKTGRGLIYEKYSSEIDWIIDYIWDLKVGDVDRTKVIDCANEWDAEDAFLGTNSYVVRYENTIFVYKDFDETVLTKDQIHIIREKLDLR